MLGPPHRRLPRYTAASQSLQGSPLPLDWLSAHQPAPRTVWVPGFLSFSTAAGQASECQRAVPGPSAEPGPLGSWPRLRTYCAVWETRALLRTLELPARLCGSFAACGLIQQGGSCRSQLAGGLVRLAGSLKGICPAPPRPSTGTARTSQRDLPPWAPWPAQAAAASPVPGAAPYSPAAPPVPLAAVRSRLGSSAERDPPGTNRCWRCLSGGLLPSLLTQSLKRSLGRLGAPGRDRIQLPGTIILFQPGN